MLTRQPAKPKFLYSRQLAADVKEHLRSSEYDLVLLNGADLLSLLDDVPSTVPTGLVAHNIEHQIYSVQLERLKSIPRLLMRQLRQDLTRLQEFELQGFRRCGGVVFLSARDESYGRSCALGIRTASVLPVFDYKPKKRPLRDPKRLLNAGFLAGFSWWPNRDAASWFIERVLPNARNVHLHLFGDESERFPLSHPRVRAHGAVQSLSAVWETCDIMICPVFAGGGVCVKLAEGLYNGMPTVSTSFAAEGLNVVNEPAVKILDDPHDWAAFLNSPDVNALVRQRPSESLIHSFSMKAHQLRFQEFVRSLLRQEESDGGLS